MKPAEQSHAYMLTSLWQTAPFWQGSDLHSSMSPSQSNPVEPAGHKQLKLLTESTHVALSLHGDDEHSLISGGGGGGGR